MDRLVFDLLPHWIIFGLAEEQGILEGLQGLISEWTSRNQVTFLSDLELSCSQKGRMSIYI
jgi:hypothetical protein